MKTLELKLKKDVLIVDLTQKVQNFKEVKITNNVSFADGKGNRTCLFIKFRDKLDDESINEYLEKGLKRIVLDYIEGEFEYKCKGSELTEEIASELVDFWQNTSNDGFIYENYKTNLPKKETAVKSFISAVESKGFHWLENPISDPNKIIQTSLSFKKFAKHSELFDRAEEKTFRNPLIFVKK